MTPMLSMMLGMLQNRNPQMFQNINTAMTSGQNPQQLLKQIMGKASPEQREGLIKQAKQFGVPDNILSQIQNLK